MYTLREAWNLGLDGINEVFEKRIIGELIGDVDNDSRLSVKDATAIQKYIAGIVTEHSIEDRVIGIYDDDNVTLEYMSDFNRDGERNIKDATAIQKYIAGLE